MAANISENEDGTETDTKKTKVSDSGYSNSCSNSQSQCSNSSKSRHSTSSGSSGYGGHPSTLGSSGDDHKKKKTKVEVNSTPGENVENVENSNGSFTLPLPADKAEIKKTVPTCIDPATLNNLASPSIESEALQVGVLAQTLFCIKTKTKTKTCEPLPECPEIASPPAPAPVSKETQNTEMIIDVLKDEIQQEKEFCVVVSLADGTVVYTTPSLTNVLGFPKDMWIGRSLVNFMHPKDRIAFASHITSAMAHSHFKQKLSVINNNDKTEDSDYFYCWIRVYNGLKTTGFNIADKKANYLPCQLSMNFKEVPDQGVLLVATSRLVKSAYKVTSESLVNPRTFTTRHTANTLISHVDNEIVSHFGYLPHDMIGRSIFDFYYTEDLPYLKDVYTNVIMEEGPLFLSRPYKFRCQNGDCVLLETEWSSFINPWGKKLEFIIGRHKVLMGPQNPDVVNPVLDVDDLVSNEEELTESKVFQEEIKVLLSEPIVRCYEPSKQQLAQLVESLGKISSTKPCEQSTEGLPPVPSAASEMLGEISPHHVYSDSKSSSAETPPSYTQLTYHENIQRFFASEPKTAGSDESPDPKTEPTQSSSSGGEDVVKSSPNNSCFNSNSNSCLKGSTKRSGNSSGPSSNSARLERTNQDVAAKNEAPVVRDPSYRPRPLTEEMLYKHNENMNKQMAQKHKKEKNKSQINRKHKSIQQQTTEDNTEEGAGGHGMKRSVSHSWEGEPLKAFKGEHRERSALPSHNPCERLQPPPPGVWSTTPSQPLTAHMSYSNPLVNPIMQLPCVYVPPAPPRPSAIPVTMAHNHPRPPLVHHRPPVHVPMPPQFLAHQVQYMPSLMYQLPLVPMVYTQAHIVPPTIKPRMAFMPTMSHINATVAQQPSSRATSVKGETGSVLCSFASASLIQDLSDLSKKENKSHMSSSIYSPGGFTTHTGKTKTGTYDNDLTHDDTSYCSYSSLFPKTEKSSDDSMKESQDKGNGQFKSWRNSGGTDGNTILRTVRKEPSWLENVEVSGDLMMRYQMSGCILNQVLQSDLEALLKFNQPEMVNEQLDQLYIDLEGLSKQLTLEESFPSSCSSGDEKHFASTPSTSAAPGIKTKKKRKFMGHDRCAMIFEEDAPMPPSSIELLAVAAESS